MGVPHSPQNLRPSGLSASGIISLAARAVQACALLHSSVSGRGRGLGTPARTLPQELMSIVGRRFSAESSTTPHAVRFGHPIIM